MPGQHHSQSTLTSLGQGCRRGNTGMEQTLNKCQHTKLTMEKTILLPGFKLATFNHESSALPTSYPSIRTHDGTRPHSSQFAEPLWTNPGIKSGISVCKLISTKKKKKGR